MIFYIDSDFKCYVNNNKENSLEKTESDFFDNKCKTFIEGYRYIPHGKVWRRKDGRIFQGEQIIPWKKYRDLYNAQYQYEQQELDRLKIAYAESETIIAELDAALLETTYRSIINEI